jgi:hypothetical protein
MLHSGKGAVESRKHCGIEINDARELYLKTRDIINTLDKYITNANIGYWSLKYCRLAMNHAKAMGLAIAYNMYKECTEGGLDQEWKCEKPVSYHKFHNIFSWQMMQWDPAHQLYLGDKNLGDKNICRAQQLNKSRCAMKK